MTVGELIEELKRLDENLEVHLQYPFGDYWRTTAAPPIGSVDEGYVKHSGYHNCDILTDEDDFEEKGKEVVKEVVLLGR